MGAASALMAPAQAEAARRAAQEAAAQARVDLESAQVRMHVCTRGCACVHGCMGASMLRVTWPSSVLVTWRPVKCSAPQRPASARLGLFQGPPPYMMTL